MPKRNKHTLVVATADHSTGGYSIGADGIYNWFSEPIKAAKRTPDFMAEKIADGADVEKTLKTYIDQKKLALTESEINLLKKPQNRKKCLKSIMRSRRFSINDLTLDGRQADILVKMFPSMRTGRLVRHLPAKSTIHKLLKMSSRLYNTTLRLTISKRIQDVPLLV